MTVVNSAFYIALISAGANPDKARAGAAAIATIGHRRYGFRGESTSIVWMLAINLVLTALIAAKLFL